MEMPSDRTSISISMCIRSQLNRRRNAWTQKTSIARFASSPSTHTTLTQSKGSNPTLHHSKTPTPINPAILTRLILTWPFQMTLSFAKSKPNTPWISHTLISGSHKSMEGFKVGTKEKNTLRKRKKWRKSKIWRSIFSKKRTNEISFSRPSNNRLPTSPPPNRL